MCNLQSNLKLNERESERDELGRKREKCKWRKRHGIRENARIESPRHLYSLLTKSLQDLSKISSRTVYRSVERAGERKRRGSGGEGGRKERQHNAREDRETLSPPFLSLGLSQTPSEATEILEAPLCFWLPERVKIPPCKTLSECGEGSLKMFRKRRTARII